MEKIDIVLWIIGGTSSAITTILIVMWTSLNKRIESIDKKIDRLDDKVTDIDRRVCRMEGSLSNKEGCYLKTSNDMRKAE